MAKSLLNLRKSQIACRLTELLRFEITRLSDSGRSYPPFTFREENGIKHPPRLVPFFFCPKFLC